MEGDKKKGVADELVKGYADNVLIWLANAFLRSQSLRRNLSSRTSSL